MAFLTKVNFYFVNLNQRYKNHNILLLEDRRFCDIQFNIINNLLKYNKQ